MGYTIAEKIIKNHLSPGMNMGDKEIAIKIDQTLTQDSTGTMAYLQFEAIGVDRVKTKRSVAYIDHNTLQTGPENADDHLYIQSVAKKHGIYFSKAGNGICHQVNLERFAVPGETLLGSDSHTPTAGGIGMLAIGAGGLDVAVAMGGGAYYLKMPEIVKVNLTGRLKFPAASKDIILELLKRLTVKGGVGKIFEYSGDGVLSLSVPERATITNMGAELGATTSIFPSDARTYEFLKAQGRQEDFIELNADSDAVYSKEVNIDLDELKPLAACPHSPDSVAEVSELKGIKVNQVAIGSCTNSSYFDLMKCVEILKGKKVNDNVSLVIAPGSRQVLNMLSQNGGLSALINAGARILECACGPCIGMGQSPSSNGVSLRTFNRNFEGRSGTKSAQVYLVSPEVAAASAIVGYIASPEDCEVIVDMPENFAVNDNMIAAPAPAGENVEIVRGPNIKPFPRGRALEAEVSGKVLIKLADNITTDHIMPSNSKLLPYRSNIPYLSDYCLAPCDDKFSSRAKGNDGGFIVAGENYGQGSSREHAALVPLYLGIKAVFAKSFARIHKANLINNGILPLVFENPEDYENIEAGDDFVINDTVEKVKDGHVIVNNITKNTSYTMSIDICEREQNMLLCGGLLNYTKQKVEEN